MAQTQQRYIRLKDAPAYLGMNKNLFNKVVRPALIEIPIGIQGVAFDVLDLDAWAEHYKHCNGRPVSKEEGGDRWHVREHRDFKKLAVFGTSIKGSTATDFAKVLEQVTLKKQKNI
jgi:hypothetical protein